ncbi:Hok/Gef family protein [Escherichia coli]|uniref:Hok/Gef family protein n=1 Tax=Escherichia coli TaxID=562 RepID=UPI00109CCEE5|nr:Hok/Gef family protein [Escherichia coli]
MKQQKAMLIALIVICLTVIVTALVTRKDLCEVRIRTGLNQQSDRRGITVAL